jgi:hypothetical protein
MICGIGKWFAKLRHLANGLQGGLMLWNNATFGKSFAELVDFPQNTNSLKDLHKHISIVRP